MCLDRGYHPRPFCTAVLCVLDKMGKRDKASPRLYRLISFLSVLGKELERIIGCWLAWLAVTNQAIPLGYFGALPLRLASDLACILADNAKLAFSQKQSLSILTLDVKGAFDTVLLNCLLHRLRD